MPRTLAVFLPLLAFLGSRPALLPAQETRPVVVGTPIRVTLAKPDPRFRGIFADQRGDSILVQVSHGGDTATRAVSLARVRRLEALAGRHRPVGRSMLRGALIGGGIGLVFGLGAPLCEGGLECLFQPTGRGQAIAWGVAGGGAYGAMVGAVAGLIRRDRWVTGALEGWSPVVRLSARGAALGVQLPVGW